MSGWIKVDKDLTESIRFRRVVRKLRDSSNALRGVTQNSEAFAVTITLGALIRFWCYADSHIGDDNVLNITLDEINDLIGVDGFAQALPADWLQVIDAEHVQLPNFLEHNGSSEKQRRDNARRQANYRHRHQSRNVTRYVTADNASNDARPDQTRQDKTRPDHTQDAREVIDPYDVTEGVRMVYPRGTFGAQNWILAHREIGKLLDLGEDAEAIRAAAHDYAAQQTAKGSVGTQYIRSPEKFYRDGFWRGPFPLPASKAEISQDSNITASKAWLEKSNAAQ